MSDASSGRPLTAYEQWIVSREQPAEQEQRPITEGLITQPRWFKDPPAGQARSTTIPAGTSQFANVEDPSPTRVTGEQRRQAYAEASREAERMTRLSGSGTNRVSAREAAKAGWEPVKVRDAMGRIRIDWQRISETGEIT